MLNVSTWIYLLIANKMKSNNEGAGNVNENWCAIQITWTFQSNFDVSTAPTTIDLNLIEIGLYSNQVQNSTIDFYVIKKEVNFIYLL